MSHNPHVRFLLLEQNFSGLTQQAQEWPPMEAGREWPQVTNSWNGHRSCFLNQCPQRPGIKTSRTPKYVFKIAPLTISSLICHYSIHKSLCKFVCVKVGYNDLSFGSLPSDRGVNQQTTIQGYRVTGKILLRNPCLYITIRLGMVIFHCISKIKALFAAVIEEYFCATFWRLCS